MNDKKMKLFVATIRCNDNIIPNILARFLIMEEESFKTRFFVTACSVGRFDIINDHVQFRKNECEKWLKKNAEYDVSHLSSVFVGCSKENDIKNSSMLFSDCNPFKLFHKEIDLGFLAACKHGQMEVVHFFEKEF